MTWENPPDDELRELLRTSRTIAVVGCSPDATRTSHQIARTMQQRGYRIIPVHPEGGEILGERVYPDLASIPADVQVDIVDVFRRAESTPEVARAAAARPGVRALWLQQGIVNEEAGGIARDAKLLAIQDACIGVYHRMLLR